MLVGSRVRLRPADLADVEARLENGRHPEIDIAYGGTGTDLAPFTREDAVAWVEAMMADPLAWVIEYDGRCIGGAGLHSLNEHDRRATYAVGLQVPQLLGKGLGTEATQLVLQHAFGTMRLHRVGLRVLAGNSRAIRCYQKCGFVIEGHERESARVGDGWQDDVMMGLLAAEGSTGSA